AMRRRLRREEPGEIRPRLRLARLAGEAHRARNRDRHADEQEREGPEDRARDERGDEHPGTPADLAPLTHQSLQSLLTFRRSFRLSMVHTSRLGVESGSISPTAPARNAMSLAVVSRGRSEPESARPFRSRILSVEQEE